ncbi:hypothetical protein MFIFM68171_02204 [Madurella fahalii]|uniref:Protein kinase domain-containing protein n=1 Tax=Madurella fahalii TaxID=1157608 RepID=A0ABQ0G2Q3_9PEZI
MDHDHDRNNRNNNYDDDDNVIAYIYPAVGTLGYDKAAHSIKMNRASPLYRTPRRRRPQVVEAPQPGPPDIFARHEREPTVEEEEDEEEGLRAGQGSDAELHLPRLPGVSAYYFALTFDTNYCLIVRDLGSKGGITVIYDDMERGRWRSFDWIVGGSNFLQKVNSIIVKVSKFLQFRLVVPRHDVGSKSYRDKADRFPAGTTDAEQLLDFDCVGPLSRVDTAGPSEAETPASGPGNPVTVYKKLGAGGFGVVYHVWNVSTGEQYALKKPKEDSGHEAQWEREIVILERINHKHIVSILNSCSASSSWLHLEYMPEGSISDHLRAGCPFSEHECKRILVQASDALAYLHSQDPQIVHRDVKPSNILILHRRPGDLFIKFADFGISCEGDALKTICGTYVYLAPEVYKAAAVSAGKERSPAALYTALVDVWSLGVVLARLLYGLPKLKKDQCMGVEWCERIREKVEGTLQQGPVGGRQRRQDPLFTSPPELATAPTSSIDSTALAALLDQIPSDSERRATAYHCPSSSCSSTVEPPEDEDHEYEIKCYQALIDDGGRPLFHSDLLPQIEANPDAYTDLLRPWARQQHPADAKEPWLALSRQWNRWKEFRTWQLRGRRRRPAFEEYLDAERRDFLMCGGLPKHADGLNTKGSYSGDPSGCCRTRRGRTSRRQKRAKTRKGYEGKYRAAKTAAEQQQSRVDWVLSEIDKIEAEQKVAAPDENGGSSTNGSNSAGSRKTRHTDETSGSLEDVVEPRLRKRRRTKNVEETVKMVKTDETEKMPAGKSDSSSHTRRSKRRRPSTAADENEEEDVPEPRSKRSKVASTSDDPSSSILQRQASDREALVVLAVTITSKNTPSHCRRSRRIATPYGTVAVTPDPRGERLKSLRPRVDGKVVTVPRASRRQHRGARRSRGRPPRVDAAARRIS